MPDTQRKKFYLTTPIYYVNARPHIGHAYTTIVADVVARRHRLLGADTYFLTGTDEHGQKIERAAAAQGIPPQQFADQVSASFSALWKRMGITNDQFIRTTDPKHQRGAQKLFQTLFDRGFIELRSYTSTYCVSDEAFVDVPVGAPCPECGRITETITEENFFFKLSEFQQPLLDLIESGTLSIEPEARRNEVLSFVRGNVNQTVADAITERGIGPDQCVTAGIIKLSETGVAYVPGALKDLSISRTSFKWGIPVPGNDKHVIYVWLDALTNYMSAIGYGSDDPADIAQFKKYWPADLHLVGKEIIRFHCVYWPAFLLAADLPLPKKIQAHGWLLFEESKMSKSRGNIVRTETILDAFGPLCPPPPPIHPTTVILSEGASAPQSKDLPASDATTSAATASLDSTGLQPGESGQPQTGALAPGTSPTKAQQDLFAADILRYFLLREIPFGQDGSFSFDAVIQRYNADLANGYGNLVSRVLKLIEQNYSGTIPSEGDAETDTMWPYFSTILPLIDKQLGEYELSLASTNILNLVSFTDSVLTKTAPWKLVKSDKPEDREYAKVVLGRSFQAIRIITALLYPILPYATASVWSQLGLGSIEQAAQNGDLKNLQWGGLQPGTKLGPLSPIFPRADKGLAQIMTNMESPTPQSPAPTDPHAGPRTASLPIENPGATVAGSHALTTERPGTPPHGEAPASGVFAAQSSQLKAESSTETASPTISIDDFVKVDLRVAQIVVAERIPKADKLLRLEVDLGPSFEPSRRQILSGIAEWYTPEELIGRRIAIIANLAPRKMRGLESHGMLLAASGEDHASKPILATFSDEIALGSRIR